jgi:oxygen-independent coproporphyrinogen-3 oxidase
VRKCPYCDFNSHELRDATPPEDEYVAALLADLEAEAAGAGERTVSSVFMGGGTPSLLSVRAISRLLAGVRTRVPVADDAEVSLEANPGTLDSSRLPGYRQAGVNRLSLGIQSFDARHLRAIGRIHGPDEALRAVALAREAGFDNLNLDLMYGLPDQRPEEAAADLEAAIGLDPRHISRYQLTLEPNTRFAAQPPILPDDEILWAMQRTGERRLAAAGFRQYEVSAYARPGHECRHNRNYWEFGDYLGIGAGAHGKLTDTDGRVQRSVKHRHPRQYMQSGPNTFLARRWTVQGADLLFEFALNALRLVDGVPWQHVHQRLGAAAEGADGIARLAESRGLLEANRQHLRCTALGQRYLNELLELFLPDAA